MKPQFNTAAPALTAAEAWLQEQGRAYEKQEDGTIFVRGGIELQNKGLTVLPDLSNVVVEGWFDCSYNNLTSLKGAPRKCKVFNCRNNKLESIEYASKVDSLFYCQENNLTHLEPVPEDYAILMTDWGNFTMANPPPENLRFSAETRRHMEEEATETAISATILQSSLSIRRPLKLRSAEFVF